MRHIIGVCGVTFAALTILAGAASAGGSPATTIPAAPASDDAAPPAERIALVKRYFAEIKLDERMEKLIANLLPVLINQAQMGVPAAADKRDAVIAAVEEASAEWMPSYMDRMAIEYARVLTDDEVTAAINFYGSPQGKSLVAKEGSMAPIATKVMIDMQPGLQSLMLEHLCRKIDCRAAKSSPSTGKS